MEGGFPKKRNIRPVEKSNLPLITLMVLVALVLGMLYVGYEYISDSSSNSEELTSKVVDSTSMDNPDGTEQIAKDAGPIEETPVEPKVEAKKKEEAPKKQTPVVSKGSLGGQQITHEVKSGETFSSIASRYNLKTETLKGLNPSVTDVKGGVTKLIVQVQTIHTVGPGDVLRVVSQKYGITKDALMKANAKSKDFSERGEKLVIPFADRK
jgi:LysM repeat protein